MEAYIQGMQHTLSHLSGQVITPLDFSDRLGHLLQHLSKPTYWHEIERELNRGVWKSMPCLSMSSVVMPPPFRVLMRVRDGGLLQVWPQ